MDIPTDSGFTTSRSVARYTARDSRSILRASNKMTGFLWSFRLYTMCNPLTLEGYTWLNPYWMTPYGK